MLTLETALILSFGLAGLMLVKLRKNYLKKFVLTTTIYALAPGKTYFYKYLAGLIRKKYFQIAVNEVDEKKYIIKETIYYSLDKNITLTVLQAGITVYTVELRNVILEDSLVIGETEENGNL
jgi:hypothetical protein